MPQRVIIFIDAKNTYKGARDAFFEEEDSHVLGQFDPIALAEHISERRPTGREGEDRELNEVRVYTGRPSATKDPKTYGSHLRQCDTWEKRGVIIIHRTLRYPRDWPRSRPQEKGIDVALAVDYVIMAMEEAFDVGVIMSTDTDIKPALEYVLREGSPVAEVAAWRSDRSNRRLSVKGHHLWCHYLYRSDYDLVCDHTHYTIPA